MTEEWSPIPAFDGYEVSSGGRVRSVRGELAGWVSKGYRMVALRRENRTFTRSVHTLVLLAFVGPRPDGMEACHGDGDPLNNELSNLRWDSSSANKRDIVRHGNHHWANRKACPKGHALVAPNLVRSSLALGSRLCRACNQAYAHRRRHGGDIETIATQKYNDLMGRIS